MNAGQCRFCGANLTQTFCDLKTSPLSNIYLTKAQLAQKENFYPLHAYVCESCYLVQIQQVETPENIFTNYAYFSSYSDIWVAHCKNFTQLILDRFTLGTESLVIEIASNDACLLKNFKDKEIPVLGIEPAENLAQAAQNSGIPCLVKFFSKKTAEELRSGNKQADLLLGNNVLAHVPDLNDFVAGLKVLLRPHGNIVMEFPHLLRLIEENQFDTIYHEHFSYFSLFTVEKIFANHGLVLFDVEKVSTHGGSLRIFARHSDTEGESISPRIASILNEEEIAGLTKMDIYKDFSDRVKEAKTHLLNFFTEAKKENKTIVGYGAPAKGNTLLNYCQINTNMIDYTVDRNPHKQNRYLPGTHIPVYHPDKIRETQPDYLLILPWNIKDEIIEQMSYIREWGGEFVVPIPKTRVIP